MRRGNSLLVATALAAMALPPASAEPPQASPQCIETPRWSGVRAIADELLQGRYRMPGFPPVQLGLDLNWTEDPFNDASWVRALHALSWTRHLLAAWKETHDPRYLLRWRELLADWVEENPRVAPPSAWSWDNHATAYRGMVFACAAGWWPQEPWMRTALTTHGAALRDPRFVVQQGNHAVDQSLGLLALGCVTSITDWIETAETRMERLVRQGIDEQGATNEGSAWYGYYNFDRFREALVRTDTCDRPRPSTLQHRLTLLDRFLAFSSLVDGGVVPFGDTAFDLRLRPVDRYIRYAITNGEDGTPIGKTRAVYRKGWAFGRSSWRADAFQYALRFGPGGRIHAHDDSASLFLSSGGQQIVTDSGLYRYRYGGRDPRWRDYFVGPEGHNLLIPDGARWYRTAKTQLRAQRSVAGADLYVLDAPVWSKVAWRRTILVIPAAEVAVILDQASSPTARRWRQTWHLAPGTAAQVHGLHGHLDLEGAEQATITMTGSVRSIRSSRGSKAPIRGWSSPSYGKREPATVLEGNATGRRVRMLTTISAGGTVRAALRRGGFSVRLPSGNTLLVEGTLLSAS